MRLLRAALVLALLLVPLGAWAQQGSWC